MSAYSVDPSAVIALGNSLGPIGAQLGAANRHRTAGQAGLVGDVGSSYDRFRRSLYLDGLCNQQAVEVLAMQLGKHGAEFERVENHAKLATAWRGGGRM